MFFDAFEDLNWLAIVVASLAWFAFSAVWYSIPPVSGPWQRAAKVDMASAGAPLPGVLAATLILYIVISSIIALIVRNMGVTETSDALQLGVALGLAFGLAQALITQIYEKKGSAYWLINGINGIVAYSIVSVIVTVWD